MSFQKFKLTHPYKFFWWRVGGYVKNILGLSKWIK